MSVGLAYPARYANQKRSGGLGGRPAPRTWSEGSPPRCRCGEHRVCALLLVEDVY